ncbi:hypothetical protein GCM10011376_32150 [Nocardioides flavus (ex Wang et al. 2016)]|uniref:DUF3558 domain-containing protein n=1 Tax=Nocardioides flavus (ex Wang et al. 2016) TaxID=2058780 RepID=A0ABQ3HLP5_9ACTN|nr:hypothetical protein [Nocardioides flavus (ex Wang et al. 2016)]GHE18605.1 hypothetical protein GCM10011376_32150 [Nocardioides flavus (ex Wang et al. 2016)]
MTMPGRRGPSPLLAVLLATVLLAGCTGGSSEPSGDGSEPTNGASESSESPDETTEPAEPEPTVDVAAVENINPCESLAPQEWRPFVPRAQRESVRLRTELTGPITLRDAIGALVLDDTPKYGCVVSYRDKDGDEVDVAAWGWFLGEFGPDDVNRILASAGGTATNRGYAAITTSDFTTVNGYGFHGNEDVGFWVLVKDSVVRRFEQGDAAKRQKTTDKLLAVLDSLSLDRDDQPRVLLPDACPRNDDSRVRAVIGRATTARGFDDGAGRIQCLYRNPERDRTLRLTAGPIPQEQADALAADAARPAKREYAFPVDEGDTGIAVAVRGGGTASSALVRSEELLATFAAVEIGNLGVRAPDVPRQAVIDLLTSFDDTLAEARDGD